MEARPWQCIAIACVLLHGMAYGMQGSDWPEERQPLLDGCSVNGSPKEFRFAPDGEHPFLSDPGQFADQIIGSLEGCTGGTADPELRQQIFDRCGQMHREVPEVYRAMVEREQEGFGLGPAPHRGGRSRGGPSDTADFMLRRLADLMDAQIEAERERARLEAERERVRSDERMTLITGSVGGQTGSTAEGRQGRLVSLMSNHPKKTMGLSNLLTLILTGALLMVLEKLGVKIP